MDQIGPEGYRPPVLDMELLAQVRTGVVVGHPDAEVAVALARLNHDEFEKFGTDSTQLLTEVGSRETLRSLISVAKRLGISDFSPPFSDFSTFKTYWNRNDGYGSWQARRDMLNIVFEPLHVRLADLEAGNISSSLVSSISPHKTTGWPRVDEEIAELRRHFEIAVSPQDYRNAGNDCVTVLEALSAVVYDAAVHLRSGESEPPVASTKDRFDRYVEVSMPGPENASLRKLTRASIEMAQGVKHRPSGTRMEAGIAADAVIQLANIFRRLQEI
ncbi:hypothetical protein EDD25_0606 [Cryobacterium psychrophilum]|nr:hypothetical protein EDD25_0606 [Cryobacterium psychrophilum]